MVFGERSIFRDRFTNTEIDLVQGGINDGNYIKSDSEYVSKKGDKRPIPSFHRMIVLDMIKQTTPECATRIKAQAIVRKIL